MTALAERASDSVEEIRRTQQEYLRIATETGELRGTRVEFTADGTAWHEAVFTAGEHPIAARATVYREGWQIPTVVAVLWDESIPVDAEWQQRWLADPHALFGAFALRTALRRAFADVLSDRREPDDRTNESPARPERTAAPATPRDWAAELATATTDVDVRALHADMKAARAVTAQLHAAVKGRLRAIAEPAPAAPAAVRPTSAATPLVMAGRKKASAS